MKDSQVDVNLLYAGGTVGDFERHLHFKKLALVKLERHLLFISGKDISASLKIRATREKQSEGSRSKKSAYGRPGPLRKRD